MTLLPPTCGNLRQIQIPSPTPPAQLNYQLPPGLRWRLISFICSYSDIGAAGNLRLALVIYRTGNNPLIIPSFGQYAGFPAADQFSWSEQIRPTAAEIPNSHTTPLPSNLILSHPDRIQTQFDTAGGPIFAYIYVIVDEFLS